MVRSGNGTGMSFESRVFFAGVHQRGRSDSVFICLTHNLVLILERKIEVDADHLVGGEESVGNTFPEQVGVDGLSEVVDTGDVFGLTRYVTQRGIAATKCEPRKTRKTRKRGRLFTTDGRS